MSRGLPHSESASVKMSMIGFSSSTTSMARSAISSFRWGCTKALLPSDGNDLPLRLVQPEGHAAQRPGDDVGDMADLDLGPGEEGLPDGDLRPLVAVRSRVRELPDLKLYVDTPDDIRFIRRLQRDIKERGRTLESVVRQYLDVVRPGHLEFTEPTKAYADLIIPEGGSNEKALQVLASFMQAIR